MTASLEGLISALIELRQEIFLFFPNNFSPFYDFTKKVGEKFGIIEKTNYLCSRETGYVERETHRFYTYRVKRMLKARSRP